MTQIKKIFPYFIAVVAAFIAAGIFIAALKFNPFKAYETILTTSFRTPNGFIQTLVKWVPLTLVSLAFTVPLSSG